MVRPLRVAIDGTSLLGPARTGIGTYVAHLVEELSTTADLDVRVAAFSLRGREALRRLPAGVRAVHRPVPARVLHRAWARGAQPSAELVVGRVDCVHGPNFTLAPPRRAAGVVTVHDLSYLHHPELVDRASLRYRELVPRALERAAAVITPTQAVADELIAVYGPAPELVHVTALGVDPSWSRAHADPQAALPERYVLAVGTLEPRKGLDVLISAYELLLAEDPGTPPLVLVGPPGWGPALRTSALPPQAVIQTGYLTPSALRSAVAGASVLAFPSRYEGFGLPPLEAMAAGTAVVAGDVPAVREVLAGHARLVAPGDAPALADALRATLLHPPTAAARQAAREHAAGFTWRRCAQRTAEVYRQVASRRLS